MKLFPILTFAAAASFANADTIRIVASNGDRTATQTAISNLLGGANWTFRGTTGSASKTGATVTGLSNATASNFGAWSGTYAGTPVTIKVSYSGALAGIAAVASGLADQHFVVSNGNELSGGVLDPATLPDPLLTATFETGAADFGFSTNFQTTSPYNGVYNGVSYDTVVEEVVGVSPLAFYASPGFPGDNITTQLAQSLYTNGSVSVALFTGDFTNHATQYAYAIGRNTDAGQRYGAYTEIGLGTTGSVTVWRPTITGATTTGGVTSGGTATSHILWPAETWSNVFSAEGNGGYTSGANLAPTLTVQLGADAYKGKYDGTFFLHPDATAGYYIGYLTPGDGRPRVLGVNATTLAVTGNIAPGNRGVELKFNGVPLTDDNVRTGRYTAWVYNRILKPTSLTTGFVFTFANDLRDRIRDFDAPAGGGIFNNAAFKVKRFTDGGLVVPK